MYLFTAKRGFLPVLVKGPFTGILSSSFRPLSPNNHREPFSPERSNRGCRYILGGSHRANRGSAFMGTGLPLSLENRIRISPFGLHTHAGNGDISVAPRIKMWYDKLYYSAVLERGFPDVLSEKGCCRPVWRRFYRT